MKTTQKNLKAVTFARLSRWAVFVAAVASMLAVVAVLAGWPDGKLARLATSANEARPYYASAGNADMSVIFQAR